jgi:hypothetical protein
MAECYRRSGPCHAGGGNAGWFVERKSHGEVLVFSGKELRSHLLKVRSAKPLSAEMQRAVHQVERQCRDVAPSYRPDKTNIGER